MCVCVCVSVCEANEIKINFFEDNGASGIMILFRVKADNGTDNELGEKAEERRPGYCSNMSRIEAQSLVRGSWQLHNCVSSMNRADNSPLHKYQQQQQQQQPAMVNMSSFGRLDAGN